MLNEPSSDRNDSQDYLNRLDAERQAFAENTDVHDLPEICLYWLSRYVLPRLASFGYSDADVFFRNNLERAWHAAPTRSRRFLSIGAGNCDTEIRLASGLRGMGLDNFTIDCLDLNPQMLARGEAAANDRGLAACIRPLLADFNCWRPETDYDAVLVNHALHHVLQLEQLFDAVRDALTPEGLFIVSDMIGRNGHRRWPEALVHVERFWAELPAGHRYNHQHRKQETDYVDWDCSTDGFEGIRAQDILPLLLPRFQFRFFYAFANVTGPFIDRSFGPNFNSRIDWDRHFIDRVHAFDEGEILSGRIKPTIMLAVLSKTAASRSECWKHLTPEFCVRWP